MSFLITIYQLLNEDLELAKIFENVREYAELYLISKERQKGCDGMGEVATLKDEFIYYINKMVRYCEEKGYLKGDTEYDLDEIIINIMKLNKD